MRQYPFLQKITSSGDEIDIDLVLSSAYIELADIGGTKLILTLADQAGYFRDTMAIKKGTELELTLADLSGGDEELWNDKFIVAKASSPDGSSLKLECFQKQCESLKLLSALPMFINEQKPAQTLAKLLPDFKIDCDDFPTLGTYHLNAGGTKSRLLRTMARDYGAICFYARGTLYFKNPKLIISKEPEVTLEYSNPQAEHPINKYQVLGQEGNCSRIVDKCYLRWDAIKGLQKSASHQDKAPVMISCTNQQSINGQNIVLLPVIDVELVGLGSYAPAVCCGLVFHKRDPENLIDESIPSKVLITQVTHYQQGYKYLCKLQLGVIHE